MRGVLIAAVIALALVASTSGSARSTQLQQVTLIGDSVADAIAETDTAIAIVGQGVNLDLQVTPCRRVEGVGCPYLGARPPSVVELTQSLGSKLGPNVVVSVGYNDFEDQYAANIEDALAALKAAGVKHVWWLTLRAAHHPYVNMNDDIEAAAQHHPELSVIDWNVYSRSHPDWFQTDGLHLLYPGALAMATLIHKTLVSDGVAAPPVRIATTTLPLAHRDQPYRARLVASSGVAPYRWSLLERAPAGIHLEASGSIVGTPRVKAGRYTFNVRVKDAAGSMATRRLTLRIAR